MSYTPEHLAAALTWIEHNQFDGIRIVARALAKTAPPSTPAPAAVLPDADVWKWTCHRCGYFVESVVEDETMLLRAQHIREEHGRAPSALREGQGGMEPKSAASTVAVAPPVCAAWCGIERSEAANARGRGLRVFGYFTNPDEGYRFCYCRAACRDAGKPLNPAPAPQTMEPTEEERAVRREKIRRNMAAMGNPFAIAGAPQTMEQPRVGVVSQLGAAPPDTPVCGTCGGSGRIYLPGGHERGVRPSMPCPACHPQRRG